VKLPNADRAFVPPEKLTDYLLSPTHPVGRLKAPVFWAFGFDAARTNLLEAALLELVRDSEVTKRELTLHGTKYVVDGPLTTPRGEPLLVRTVWIVEMGKTVPRFVTAYPT
jgi:hypothetical protein